MNIAIIGAGNVGNALAGSFRRAGHNVTLSSANPEDARNVAQVTGARAAGSNREAVQASEAVVLAVPYPAIRDVMSELGGSIDGKILIDATNRVDLSDPGHVLDGTSVAEQVQKLAPRARVVKAFNTILAARQAEPTVDGMPVDGFVAGDDEQAKKAVLDLVKSVGFRPIDAGPLVMARSLEAMALLNMVLQARNGWPWQSAWKLLGPTGQVQVRQ